MIHPEHVLYDIFLAVYGFKYLPPNSKSFSPKIQQPLINHSDTSAIPLIAFCSMHFFTTVAITVVLLLCNCDSEFIYPVKLLFFEFRYRSLCSVNCSQWNHEVWQPQYQQPCIISLHLHQPNLFTTLRTGLDYPVHLVFTVSLEESGNFWTFYYCKNDFNRIFILEKLWDYLLSTLHPKDNQITMNLDLFTCLLCSQIHCANMCSLKI